MAVVPGKNRPSPTVKRMKAANAKLQKGRAATSRYFTQRACTQCDPTEWIRIGDWENHRANYHRPGGYMYEKRKANEKARAEALAAQEKAAATAAKAPPPRPARPVSRSKTASKGSPVAQNDTSQPWKSPAARNGSANGSGGATGNQATAATSMTEGIVEMFRTWAIQTPPSIPASRVDAQAAADMWRGIADALRARARAEQENNHMPANIVEPLEQAAQVASQIGDQHMEVVRRVESRYGEVAEVLSRPDTPDHTYLSGGR